MAGAKFRLKDQTAKQALKHLVGRRRYVPLRTGRRRGLGSTPPPWQVAPPGWKGTLPEWAIQWAHIRLGLKEDQDYVYQYQTPESPNGLDFFELDVQIAIQVQGIFWHYGFGAAKMQSDLEQRIRLESVGIQVINIDETDALNAPVYYLTEARSGRDHSLLQRGAA